MARYEKSYEGERRIRRLAIKLTPTERAQLQHAAMQAGAQLSEYVRELCLRRDGPEVVAGTRRNPDAKALMNELIAIGNNLNQLARHANTTGDMPQLMELRMATDFLKVALSRVLAL
jgi:hypothetical protein